MNLKEFISTESYTKEYQLIGSLCLGILFGPYSWGLFYLLLFIIIYELIIFILTKGNPKYWNHEVRAGIIMASIFGWLIGRELTLKDCSHRGVPQWLHNFLNTIHKENV